MKPDQCRRLMKEMLDEELYRHSLGVAEAALSLSECYGADTQKAYLAGMIHDYGKRYTKKELLRKAQLMGLSLDRITRQEKRLLHAPVGAALIRSELKIKDPDIIKAVAYHTTGRSGMTLLEKVIYLADYIEAGREFKGVELIREIAAKNIDQALLVAVNQAIKSVLARDLMLHPRSVVFRNSLLAGAAGQRIN
jgi:predicted HD superfamily hydrolase involved in NAD metabolism